MSKYEKYTKEQLIAKIKQFESKKNYGLVWDDENEPEKVVIECQNNIPILKKIDNKTIHTNKNKPNNILIEGDNYHALQVLNYTHKGQIDVIYIDPPYNTGSKDFKYNDSFVDKEDGYRHSKWLNFMSKRLKLAHNLLKNDGVIFISIDDNEQARLKVLCDEIFGETNFVAQFIWQKKKGGGNDSKYIATEHEYVLMFARSKDNLSGLLQSYDEDYAKRYKEEDKDGRYYWDTFKRKSGKQYYPITCPDGTVLKYDENGNPLSWLRSEARFYQDLTDGEVKFEKNKNGWSVFFKQRMPEGKTPRSLLLDYGTTSSGSNELLDLFKQEAFQNPKPLKLLKYLVEIGTSNNGVILDFFAGSGTTGHAVLALNQEDGGNRQFILCTNNENDICTEVTYPRLSKVINGYSTPKGIDVSGLAGNLDYYKTDLVPTDGIANISDTTREELTKKAGNMIAIKENTHALVELNDYYQIFSNKASSKQTAIYFTEDLSHFDELIEKTKGHKIKLYIFSFGKIDKSSYKYLGKNFEIEDIPEPIIEIYKEINKEGVL